MKTNLPIRFLRLEKDGFHLQVKMKINGKAANMLIDTGASKSVFDKTRIAGFMKNAKLKAESKHSTGLGTNTMESHTVLIKKIQVGALLIKSYNSVVLDLSHVNSSYQKMKFDPIDGVLGGDILTNYKAVIDYKKKILTLELPSPKKKKK